MRLNIVRKKNDTFYYVIESLPNGSTRTYEKIGSHSYLLSLTDDPLSYAKKRVQEINESMKNEVMTFNEKVDFRDELPSSEATVSSSTVRNVGWLYLNEIYEKLGIDQFLGCVDTQRKYDLDAIDRHLVMNQILNPGSKLSAFGNLDRYQSIKRYDLHQSYRFLSDLDSCGEKLQAHLFRKTKDIVELDTSVLMYDLTNFYFETEEADIDFLDGDNILQYGFRKYGHSKEHRPNPIVQMGLFMDYSGLPLTMCITDGNANEQTTLLPLEQKILRDFGTSRFVVCTDAGLSSEESRKFNNFGERSFVTTQSIKKMKKERKEWCLDPEGWHVPGSSETFSIDGICANDVLRAKHYETIFYKEAYIEGYDEQRDIEFNQTLIVTFSLKYRDYLKSIRDGQIERARSLIRQGISKIDRRGQQDPRRFITRTSKTSEGKTASKTSFAINEEIISEESAYDGFYAVCTNLDDDISDILHVVKSRWEIEESFRIMKSEFSARPVYLQRDDRIKAHFITCFTALLIYRLLEKKLGGGFTCSQIITTLRSMRVTKAGDKGYLPSYMRTELTDALHATAGFRTDYEILRKKYMQGVVRRSKNL